MTWQASVGAASGTIGDYPQDRNMFGGSTMLVRAVDGETKLL